MQSTVMQSAVRVRPVQTKRELERFIKLPAQLYRRSPNWVAPLLMQQRRTLDRKRNPFFAHAEAEYFLAWRDGQPVGRISAHIDHNLNRCQDNRWGLFGFFECVDDQQLADELLATAQAWLQARGCDRIVGPMDFTTNDPCGLLIEGHERLPTILTPWQHPYYQQLLEGTGLTKAMDLLMWELMMENREQVLDVIWQLAADVERKHGITVRRMRRSDFAAEIERFLTIYNGAWERNWGFVPLTDDEVRHYAKELKPIIDERWAYIAEKDGEVVGASLTLPDYNQVLRHLNGRLLPFGWAKALYWRRKIDRVRVCALGVKPEFQHCGVAAKFYELHWDATQITNQKGGEMGWILETNRPMNQAMEAMGGKIVRRYRCYERLI